MKTSAPSIGTFDAREIDVLAEYKDDVLAKYKGDVLVEYKGDVLAESKHWSHLAAVVRLGEIAAGSHHVGPARAAKVTRDLREFFAMISRPKSLGF